MEIFAADGTTVYINRAGMEMTGCKDASLLVGKDNLLKDPVCMDQLGYRKDLLRAFSGETIVVQNFSAPIQDVLDRGVIEEKPWEKGIMDLYMYPVRKGEKVCFVVCLFFIKSLYYGKPEIAKAKEYIDKHWQDEFDPDAVAAYVGLSRRKLFYAFRQHAGMSPGHYYKRCKVEHIKKKLADKNLSIKQAFAACGENSRSHFAKVFREITGLSPKQYRENQA
jgi:AraC-like DNA-binding protein